MEELLEKINPKKNVVVSGGMLSGKTTNVLFPLFDKIMDNNENVIVYDTKIEYLDEYYDKLIEKGYQVKIINLRDLNHSDKWNPLDLPYYFFKNGMEDKAEELLDNLGHVIYPDNKHTDPFWVNTSSSLFVGLSLGLFEDGNVDEINLNSVNEFITVGKEKASSTNNYLDEYFKMKDKISSSYINVSSTIVAPADTRESILSVAEKTLSKLVGNAQVSSLLSGSSFNFHDLTEKKMAIFVIGKPENKNINVISEMFLNQIMQYLIETRPTNKCHIMLDNIDDIENFLYINNYLKLNNYSNTRYYIGTCSVENFESKYMINANMLSDIIRIKRDEVELDSFGVITKFNNYFKEVKINRSNVQYPIAKANDIKIFDLKEYVDTKRKERMDDLVNSVMPGLAYKIKSNDSQTRADDLIKIIDAKIAELKTENKEKKQISNKKIDIKKLENVIGETVRKIENEESDDINQETIIGGMSKERIGQPFNEQSGDYTYNEVNDLINFITDNDSNKIVFLKNVLRSIYNDSIYYAVDDCLRVYSEEIINKIDNNKPEKQVISEMLEDFGLSDITAKKTIDKKQEELLYMLNNAKLSHNKIYDDFFNEIQNNTDYLILFIKYYLILSDYELRNNVVY